MRILQKSQEKSQKPDKNRHETERVYSQLYYHYTSFRGKKSSLRPSVDTSESAAAESERLSATSWPAKPTPAESAQQSSHLSGSQSADPAQPEHLPAPIYLSHEPSLTPSPEPVPQ
nr:hypothetical protein [Tanacetum cinerariifolium]